jgi:hypothetical protein
MPKTRQNLKRLNLFRPGTDVMILKIFLPKFLAKMLAFFAQTTASFFSKNLI